VRTLCYTIGHERARPKTGCPDRQFGRQLRIVPAVIADAGEHAVRRFLEFFAAHIRNKNTRMAYRAVCHFFAWVEQHRIGELANIEPIHVAAYIEALQATAAKPTVKLHLAAIRMLFDWLIIGQVLAVNPAHAVRGPNHVVRRGKTPVLTEDQARRLLESLDTSTLVGLRDRALIAVMTYAFARIGAVVAMRVEDYTPPASAGGCGCTRKAASVTRFRHTTSLSNS
jgi:integrase/recombinase XerD